MGDNALMSDVLELVDVSVVREGRALVDQVSWSVKEGERWVILGPNGAGKTTLLNLASSYLFPSSGSASILGEELGKVDVFDLRPRIGIAGIALADKLPRSQTVLQTVLTAAYGMTASWQENYDDIDEQRARAFLDRLGMTAYLDRKFGTLSEGERKRTLIARAMMTDPELLLLDEPAAGLDLGGREDWCAASAASPATRTPPPWSWSPTMSRRSPRLHPRPDDPSGQGAGRRSARTRADLQQPLALLRPAAGRRAQRQRPLDRAGPAPDLSAARRPAT